MPRALANSLSPSPMAELRLTSRVTAERGLRRCLAILDRLIPSLMRQAISILSSIVDRLHFPVPFPFLFPIMCFQPPFGRQGGLEGRYIILGSWRSPEIGGVLK